jgi:hypothetical protein
MKNKNEHFVTFTIPGGSKTIDIRPDDIVGLQDDVGGSGTVVRTRAFSISVEEKRLEIRELLADYYKEKNNGEESYSYGEQDI